MLLPNIFYQFFFASPRSDQDLFDSEKGRIAEPLARNEDPDEIELPGENEECSEYIEEYLDTDDQDYDHDDVDDQPEQERDSNHGTSHSTQRLRHRFPTSLSFSKASAINKTWLSKVKSVLDPQTPHTDLESYVPHYRYMPIISGVVIPFSILLEIPGLTEDWYIRTEANKVVERKENTVILDVALAFSIGFAAAANLCLILRFMEKKIKHMTVLCVIFLTIHDIVNVIVVTIFGVQHRFDDGFTYGQAFWMTICSTSASLFTNVTLIFDLVRTPDFSDHGSGLTRKQRTLVISVMVLLTYIAFGALVQTFLMNLTFLDALYFSVVTIETIGFGDIPLKSTGSRIFTCLYSVFGILNLALTLGLTRETILEGIEVGYRKRVKAVRLRRKAIQWERRVLERWRAAIEWRLQKARQPVWVKNNSPLHRRSFFIRVFHTIRAFGHNRSFRNTYKVGYSDHLRPHDMHLNIEALSWPQLKAAALEAGVPLHTLLPTGFKINKDFEKDGNDELATEVGSAHLRTYIPQPNLADIPLTHARLGRMAMMLGNFALAVNQSPLSEAPKASKLPPLDVDDITNTRSKQSTGQYEAFRTSMEKEEKRAFYTRLYIIWIVFLVFWMIGSAIFMATESWTFGTAMYFCFIAFTTIGYGDFTPQSPAGRSIFIVWALLGVATVTILISILSEAYSSRYKRAFHSGVLVQAIKHYRERFLKGHPKHPQMTSTSLTLAPTEQHSDTATTSEKLFSPVSVDEALLTSRKRAESHLEALPIHVLRHARTFNENIKYLIESKVLDMSQAALPDNLQKLMDDVAGVERLGERIKEEMLRDRDARHTLLAISIENAVREMVEIAEEAIEAMKERDRLTQLHSSTEDITQMDRKTSQPAARLRHRDYSSQLTYHL